MKNYLKLIPAALALVAMASCSSDDLFEKAANSNAVDGKTMEASIEDYATTTRAAFAENKTDGKADKRALVWTAGDSYKVYGELSTPDKYTLQNASAGKASGTFDLMTEDYNENPLFAVFPYDNIDADRANNKLTVTLSDWSYATAEVKDEGYNQGGFVSNVPMFGKIGADPKQAAFGYMTAILRVDLSKLPKRSTRLIIITDRRLTGTFETEFDVNGAYPEIVSPAPVVAEYDNTTLIGGAPANGYITAISMTPVSQRTNKTFFIAVPTGNKYAKFDIYVEYNMGASTQTELVGELGNTARTFAGKSILNWQRGKVKSLTKEITVTASGNTPKEIAQFLKEEWKTFPADADINITVPDDGTGNYIDLTSALADDRTFTVPAELKNRVVNIIVPDGVTEGYNGGFPMIIQDEDPAPVASTSLREINFCIPTTAGPRVLITAPESQISFTAPDPVAAPATYKEIGTPGIPAMTSIGDMDNQKAGLYVGEGVTITNATEILDGSFISEGYLAGGVNNNGNYEILIKGDAGNITSLGDGKVTVIGALDANGDIVNTVGNIVAEGAGDVYVEKVMSVAINKTGGDGLDFTGAVTVSDVNTIDKIWLQNPKHNQTLKIEKVANGVGNVLSYGLGGIYVDDVVLGPGSKQITATNEESTSDFVVTNLTVSEDKTTTENITQVKYQGKGNVTITGVKNNKDQYPTIKNLLVQKGAAEANIGTGAVSITDVIVSTSLQKDGKGTLTITGVRDDFGAITNADGNVTITGNNTPNADITSLTHKGTGTIALKELSNSVTNAGVPNAGQLITLNVEKAVTINYENTFIGALNCEKADKVYAVSANGTKSSGIATVADTGTKSKSATKEYTTDAWDGTSWAKFASNNIYTSGSFAAMSNKSNPSGTVRMYVDVDLADKTWGGIKPAVTTLNARKVSNLKGALFQNNTAALTVTGLTIETASAANGVLMAKTGNTVTATLTAKTLTLTGNYVSSSNTGVGGLIGTAANAVTLTATVDGVTMSNAKSNAGGLIGIAEANVTITSTNVENLTMTAATGLGTDINFGGFIGEVNTASNVTLSGCNVKTAAIKGHYYMGGFIGQVTKANNVYIWGLDGAAISDKKGSTVEAITFTPASADGTWSTYKSATIAPFIGGIKQILTQLNIYGKYDSFDRVANMWKMNFLSNENYKFMGTKEDNCNFIGYIDVIAYPSPAWTYNLKHLNGFQANPSMKILTTGDNGKTADAILATDCNVYAAY